MCNCKHEVSMRVRNMLKVDNGYVNFELLSGKTHSVFTYIDEKGKEKEQYISSSYCPFCGIIYKESEGE